MAKTGVKRPLAPPARAVNRCRRRRMLSTGYGRCVERLRCCWRALSSRNRLRFRWAVSACSDVGGLRAATEPREVFVNCVNEGSSELAPTVDSRLAGRESAGEARGCLRCRAGRARCRAVLCGPWWTERATASAPRAFSAHYRVRSRSKHFHGRPTRNNDSTHTRNPSVRVGHGLRLRCRKNRGRCRRSERHVGLDVLGGLVEAVLLDALGELARDGGVGEDLVELGLVAVVRGPGGVLGVDDAAVVGQR